MPKVRKMIDLLPELAAFAFLFDAQPAPMRNAFNYSLVLMLVHAGKTCLVATEPGEARAMMIFQ